MSDKPVLEYKGVKYIFSSMEKMVYACSQNSTKMGYNRDLLLWCDSAIEIANGEVLKNRYEGVQTYVAVETF